jgi:hypothetical protein
MPVGSSGAHLVEIAGTGGTGGTAPTIPARRGVGVIIPGSVQAGVAGQGTAALTFTAMATVYTTGDITVDTLLELALDVSSGTTTTSWKYVVNRKGADGVYYAVASSATHTDSSQTNSCSIGSGTAQGSGGVGIADATTGTTKWSAPFAFGDIIQIVFTAVGAFTGTLSLKGK